MTTIDKLSFYRNFNRAMTDYQEIKEMKPRVKKQMPREPVRKEYVIKAPPVLITQGSTSSSDAQLSPNIGV